MMDATSTEDELIEYSGEKIATRQPLLWLLLGERMGDNQQVMALGKMLGYPYVTKQLLWDHECDIAPRDQGVSLIGVDIAHSDPLVPPWPDIVIAVGQRSVPASRWIVKQSGGRAINIRLGRPRIEFSAFDIIITTPQYGLPAAPNLRELLLPLTLRDDEKIAQAVRRWQSVFADLPRPWTAVLIGGSTRALAMDQEVARELARELELFRASNGGSLLLTTSPRTPEGVSQALEKAISHPHFLFQWQAGADNPYLALLALADVIIVTNDSISMIAEAVNFGKPTYLYELPSVRRSGQRSLRSRLIRAIRERRQHRSATGAPNDLIDALYDFLARHGIIRPRRDTLPLQRRLYQADVARPFSPHALAKSWTPKIMIEEKVAAAIEDIRALWHRRAKKGKKSS